MKRILGVVVLVMVSACASLNPNKVTQSWIGSHYSDQMLKWGPRTRSTPD